MKENFNIIIGNVVYIKDCNNYGVIESLYSENNCNFVKVKVIKKNGSLGEKIISKCIIDVDKEFESYEEYVSVLNSL